MPSTLALVLTILFVLFLFKWDAKEGYRASFALWIPSIWLLILGSRGISQWLTPGDASQSGDAAAAMMEGSPLDRQIFIFLIVAGMVVLLRRRISWTRVVRENPWLALYFLYCGISILWSDYPFISLKRWLKALGDPIMALVVVTESNPVRAVETIIKRCGYILLPFSILLIRYYPHLGRHFEFYSGDMSYTGVTLDKNMLGFQCMVVGLFAVYRLYVWRTQKNELRKTSGLFLAVALLSMSQWLLWTANSKTPTISLIVGILIITALALPTVRQHISGFLVGAILIFGILELSIGLTTLIITSAGRDPTLTGRTELWEIFLSMDFNYWVGHGFESFWLGDRLKKLWDMYFFKPIEAHNGYIEVYLNLGLIGLFLFGGVLYSSYNHIRKMLAVALGPELAERLVYDRFRLAYFLAYLIYNISEAGFRSLSFVFVMFIILNIRYPQSQRPAHQPSSTNL